ncbi:hypothetical protein SSU98_1465 [Streptococcus suis 98HAH33]|nr:hypothetical protein SSU98_1465 [Streptococcus suis 98HAH33]
MTVRELDWELEEEEYESIIPEELKCRNWAHAEKGGAGLDWR